MSRKTISALRRFTASMLKSAAGSSTMSADVTPQKPGALDFTANATQNPASLLKPRRPFTDDGPFSPMPTGNAPKGEFSPPQLDGSPEPTPPPVDPSIPPATSTGADYGHEPGPDGQSNEGRRATMQDAAAKAPGAPADNSLDMWHALGGLGAGGLAGYALGNMFKDKDDDSTPWLSTLAGAGLGGVGLPLLLQYLSSPTAGAQFQASADKQLGTGPNITGPASAPPVSQKPSPLPPGKTNGDAWGDTLASVGNAAAAIPGQVSGYFGGGK